MSVTHIFLLYISLWEKQIRDCSLQTLRTMFVVHTVCFHCYFLCFHHHHHHVHEGLGLIPVPWSSKWNWSLHLFLSRPMCLRPFGLYCSACLGILSVSILCMCCSHFSWYCFISFTIFSAPVFTLIHWFFVVVLKCKNKHKDSLSKSQVKNFVCHM